LQAARPPLQKRNASCRLSARFLLGATPWKVFLQKAQLRLAAVGLIDQPRPYVKSAAEEYAGKEPLRIVVVVDNCVSEKGTAAIVGGDKRCRICGGAHRLYIELQIADQFPQADEVIR
jgi:hypothetical protein